VQHVVSVTAFGVAVVRSVALLKGMHTNVLLSAIGRPLPPDNCFFLQLYLLLNI